MFSPAQTLSQLLKVNPKAARFLLGGLGVLACATIFLSFASDPASAYRAGGFIILLGLIVVIISNIGPTSLLMRTAGWALMVISFGVLIILVYAGVMPDPSPFKPIPCLLRPLQPCSSVEDRLATRMRQ